MISQSLEVSLWARWIRGSSLLVAHGDFTRGPWFGTRDVNMSNNSLGARLRMSVPRNLGTPGAENSVRAGLRRETGSDNLGPVIAEVRHMPLRPTPLDVVSVVARVSDSDGVERVQAMFRAAVVEGGFTSAPLFDDGAHGDGEAGDGLYGGQIGAFQTKVAFYVEAQDGLGTVTRFPGDAPERTCLFSGRSASERLQLLSDVKNTETLARHALNVTRDNALEPSDRHHCGLWRGGGLLQCGPPLSWEPVGSPTTSELPYPFPQRQALPRWSDGYQPLQS